MRREKKGEKKNVTRRIKRKVVSLKYRWNITTSDIKAFPSPSRPPPCSYDFALSGVRTYYIGTLNV